MGVLKLEHSNLAQHQAGIVQQLRQFWMEDHLCDVVLKSHDGAEHRAHTTLLSAASVVFRNLLSGSFREADRVKSKQPVEIAASTTAVTVLLDYMYGGQPEVPVEAGLELLRLAEAYDLPKFAAAIEAGLLSSLDSANSLQVLQEAHGLHKLKDACEKKVAEDFEACSQHPDFEKLSAGQLARILKRGDLKVSREEVVLKSIFNWLKVSEDRNGLLCVLLQHVDFQSFSFENLLRLSRCTLSGPNCEELQREVNETLSTRAQSFQSSQAGLNLCLCYGFVVFPCFPSSKWNHCNSCLAAIQYLPEDFQPKRSCFKHWSPDLGASIVSGREVSKIPCTPLCWHQGAIYAFDWHRRRILSWKPGEPATREDEEDRVLRTTGTNDLGIRCHLSSSPSGELFVMDVLNRSLLRFQDGHGHVVLDNLRANAMVCSPNGVVYLLVPRDGWRGGVVQKLLGSTLQTVIDSESLPEDQLGSRRSQIFVTKEEVIYFVDGAKCRILCVNPAESLEPVVVGQLPMPTRVTGLFVTEGGAIYASASHERKVWAFRPGDASPVEVLQCPALLEPWAILVQDKSLYVGMESSCGAIGGVYEYSLPPEFQFE